jgi:hypothetical protein
MRASRGWGISRSCKVHNPSHNKSVLGVTIHTLTLDQSTPFTEKGVSPFLQNGRVCCPFTDEGVSPFIQNGGVFVPPTTKGSLSLYSKRRSLWTLHRREGVSPLIQTGESVVPSQMRWSNPHTLPQNQTGYGSITGCVKSRKGGEKGEGRSRQ